MNPAGYLKAIEERLYDINFPSHLIVYGPERDSITRFNRATWSSVFGEQYCYDINDGIKFIDSLKYVGELTSLKIISVELSVKEV